MILLRILAEYAGLYTQLGWAVVASEVFQGWRAGLLVEWRGEGDPRWPCLSCWRAMSEAEFYQYGSECPDCADGEVIHGH